MAYPPQIYLDKDTEERLVSYIEEELTNHYSERSGWVNDLMRWQGEYWADPVTEKATYPFDGASTIVIPLTAIAVEAIHARTMTTLFGQSQFITAKAINPQWSNVAKPLERYLDKELVQNAKIYTPLNDAILECEKFGTGIGKVGYERIEKMAVREVNGIEQEFPVVVKNGCAVDAVANGRFLMPFYAQDPQMSPWVGEEHSHSPYQVKLLQDSGMFRENVMENLGAWVNQAATGYNNNSGDFERGQEELENKSPVWPKRLDYVELWMGWDVNESKREREIVVHYHRPSRTFLSIRNNWYGDLRRPYRKAVYFPVEHRWNGIGICKQNEQFMVEITAQHRQRLDNGTLSNMRMIVVSKLSGYGPDEPIFPGKMWFVDDTKHIQTLQLGEIYPSAYGNENATLIYSQQRTGVNEVTLGMPQVGTPGTATSDLARIQEGQKKYDFSYRNIKNFTNEIVIDAACCIQQFGPKSVEFFDNAEGGDLVRQYFEMPEKLIREGLLIEVATAGQQQNKIIDRQNWMQVSQLLTGYYTNIIQLAQGSGDQQMLMMIVQQAMVAATEAARQMLESFDIRNIDRLIVKQLEMAAQNPNQGGAPNVAASPQLPQSNGVGGTAQNNGGAGMASIQNLISAIGTGNAGRVGAV